MPTVGSPRQAFNASTSNMGLSFSSTCSYAYIGCISKSPTNVPGGALASSIRTAPTSPPPVSSALLLVLTDPLTSAAVRARALSLSRSRPSSDSSAGTMAGSTPRRMGFGRSAGSGLLVGPICAQRAPKPTTANLAGAHESFPIHVAQALGRPLGARARLHLGVLGRAALDAPAALSRRGLDASAWPGSARW